MAMMPYVPPPPDQNNDMRYTYGKEEAQEGAGLFIPPKQVVTLAKMYVQWRPIIGWAAKMARQKIPKELDEAMEIAAASGDPAALRRLSERDNQGFSPEGYDAMQDPEQVRVGEPVMTYQMAEEAYRMHRFENMGTRQIAEWFTNHGSPVHFQTVARWINDYEQESHIERNQRFKTIAKYALFAGLWVLSMWIVKYKA